MRKEEGSPLPFFDASMVFQRTKTDNLLESVCCQDRHVVSDWRLKQSDGRGIVGEDKKTDGKRGDQSF